MSIRHPLVDLACSAFASRKQVKNWHPVRMDQSMERNTVRIDFETHCGYVQFPLIAASAYLS